MLFEILTFNVEYLVLIERLEMENYFDEEVVRVASGSSIIQHFAIIGLFGYRTVLMSSNYAATVLIAKNGAGKTTMLGALDAFLRCQFGRLVDLDFKRIECRLKNFDGLLTLDKSDLDGYVSAQLDNQLVARHAKIHDIEVADLLFFVLWEYPLIRDGRQDLMDHPIFYKIYQHSSHTFDSTCQLLNSIFESINDDSSPIHQLRGAGKFGA